MIHDITDYLKAEEEQAIVEGLASLGKYGFSEQVFSKNRFFGMASGENRVIEHTTYFATDCSALEEDLHDVQVMHNTEYGLESGMELHCNKVEDARDYILGMMELGKAKLTDLETGVQRTIGLEGLPETDDEILAFCNTVGALGYEHDFVSGTEYRRAFGWGSCEITEARYQAGFDDIITVDVYETTSRGRRCVAEKVFDSEYGAIKALDKIMKIYDLGMSVSTQPVGRLGQKVVWRHNGGFREVPLKRGAALTQDTVDNLREMYEAGRLYLGDKDYQIPAHEVLDSFDELITKTAPPNDMG